MNLYLKTPDGDTLDLTDYDDENQVAVVVMALLAVGHEWVQILPQGEREDSWVTRWTVVERDEYNTPLQVVCEEFDGTTEIISCLED